MGNGIHKMTSLAHSPTYNVFESARAFIHFGHVFTLFTCSLTSHGLFLTLYCKSPRSFSCSFAQTPP